MLLLRLSLSLAALLRAPSAAAASPPAPSAAASSSSSPPKRPSSGALSAASPSPPTTGTAPAAPLELAAAPVSAASSSRDFFLRRLRPPLLAGRCERQGDAACQSEREREATHDCLQEATTYLDALAGILLYERQIVLVQFVIHRLLTLLRLGT